MLKIKKRGKKGLYQIAGTVAGQRVRESAGTDQEPLARARAAEIERRLLEASFFGADKTTLFYEAVELYLQKGRSPRFLEPLVAHFGKWRMDDITDGEVMKFCRLTYPEAKPQTLNRQVYSPLIAVWNVAHSAGLCSAHSFVRPEQGEPIEREPVSDEDIASILAASNPQLFAAILMLSFTGARAGEVCRVTEADVDFQASTITFRRTKSDLPRRVAMTPILREALLPLRGRQGPMLGYAQRWSLNQALSRACRRAGVRIVSTHVIGRHTFMSRLLMQGATLLMQGATLLMQGATLLMQGATLLEGMKAGGWSAKSAAMVARVYGHLEQSHVDAKVKGADALLRRKMAGRKREMK